VPVEPGKNTVRITAQDGRQNTKTQSYELVVPALAPRVFTYDANGNTLSDGLRSYEWDAENRLARVRHGDGSVTAFGYDGRGRRVLVEEKDAQGTVTSVRRYVWADGPQPAEERDGANTVLRRFYPEGEQAPGAVGPLGRLFYAKDHLGSVREVTDAAGVLRARYDYGFWGNRTRLSGDVETAVGYTGHHHHGKSGLVLTWYRAYDPDTGRWLSRDPIGEDGGLNLYGYALNNPINLLDPYGLVNWNQVMTGTLTTIGGSLSVVGGAALAGATGVTGIGAAAGGMAMFAGGTAFGLGITTIMQGFTESPCPNTPAGTIPQGPAELVGAMTGSANAQTTGGAIDSLSSIVLPPSVGVIPTAINTVINPPGWQ
jgi:RHS repeat-associated protein